MTEKFIDLVVNRLTYAKYKELKEKGEISNEELYNIIDLDNLFYFKEDTYTQSEIENRLGVKADVDTLRVLEKNFNDFKADMVSNYATKQYVADEIEAFSPVEANPILPETAQNLTAITIDEVVYKVPNEPLTFSTEEYGGSNELRTVIVGGTAWKIPYHEQVDLTPYYTAAQTDSKIKEQLDKIIGTGNINSNLDTIAELSAALKNNPQVIDALNNSINTKADKSTTYTKTEVNNLINAIDVTDQLPKDLGDLTNNAGYLKSIPSEYVTESELAAKKYLTSFTETDPTVPTWAKQSTKPKYTATEVGALPASTYIPKKVSDLENDSGFLTEVPDEYVTETELTAKKYLTAVPDTYATKVYVDTEIAELAETSAEALETLKELSKELEGQEGSLGSLLDQVGQKANKSDVYTKTEIDNKGYLTEHQDISGKADITYVITEVGKKQNKLTGTEFKKINGESIMVEDGDDSIDIIIPEVDLEPYATTEYVDNKFQTKLSVNEEITDATQVLRSITIDGLNYDLKSEDITVQSTPVSGAPKLASITIDDQSWNVDVSTEINTALNDYYDKGEIDTKFENHRVDLSDYYTKDQTNQKIGESITELLSAEDGVYETLQELANYVESDMTGSAQMLADINTLKTGMSNVYTKTETDGKYAFQTDLRAAIATIPDKTKYYTKTEVEGVIDSRIDKASGLDNYYEKSEIDTKLLNIETSVDEKQDTLTAGKSIKIEGNVISYTGEDSSEMIFSENNESGLTLRTIKVGEDVWSIGVDLSNYYTKEETGTVLTSKADITNPVLKSSITLTNNEASGDAYRLVMYGPQETTGAQFNLQKYNAGTGMFIENSSFMNLKKDGLYFNDKVLATKEYVDNMTPQIDTSNLVDLTGTQTIAGDKTFNSLTVGKTGLVSNTLIINASNALGKILNVGYNDLGLDRMLKLSSESSGSTEVSSNHKGSVSLILNRTQDKLQWTGKNGNVNEVAHAGNIKTINGESLLGSGDIKVAVEAPDLTGYATETYVNTAVGNLEEKLFGDGVADATLDTIYELSEAFKENSSIVETINDAIATKQETLVSGTNIKTVNNESILGTGNIDIGGDEITFSTDAVTDGRELKTIKVGDTNWSVSSGVSSYNDLTDKPTIPNIVYSETEPENPVLGMIWFSPAE